MTDLRKAAEEALYALELNTGCGFDHVIEALRKALAQPEQELFTAKQTAEAVEAAIKFLKREWVGLTDDDIQEAYEKHRPYLGQMMYAIEAKLKEKNNA